MCFEYYDIKIISTGGWKVIKDLSLKDFSSAGRLLTSGLLAQAHQVWQADKPEMYNNPH